MTVYEILDAEFKSGSYFMTIKTTTTILGYIIYEKTTEFSYNETSVCGWRLTNLATGEHEYCSNRLDAISEQLKYLK